MKGLDPVYKLWGAALLALVVTPVLARLAGLVWEFSQLAGYAGGLICLLLCACPLRPRDTVPPTLLSLRRHQWLGWAALILTLTHIGGLLIADRLVVEYLKTTSPLYQLAGIVAAILLLVVVLSSLAGVRRWWGSHRGFQATHVTLSLLLVALIAAHVVATDRYTGGNVRRMLFVMVTIGAIAMPLRARAKNLAARASGAGRQLVFGRHSAWVACAIAIAVAAVASLSAAAVHGGLREPLLRRATLLPLDFPHDKHTAVNCLLCHHNYVDKTGLDTCIRCHRSKRTDLKEGAEARFHSFCFDCHRNPDAKFERHGPPSGCTACHRALGSGVATPRQAGGS